MELGLNEKVAFVAGSSRGIGLAIAAAFLDEGAKVIISGRDEQLLNAAHEVLAIKAKPERVLAVHGDMTEPQEIRSAFATGIASWGGIDVVVANIGSGSGPRGWQLTPSDWETALQSNLVGSMNLANEALTHLADRGAGNLIFISSIAGREALDAPIAYSAAKAALLAGMKSLARLAAPKGVRVNAVVPGNIIFPGGTWEKKLAERREVFENYIQSEVPLQRFGRPEEIADVVVFLASGRASFITGACVVVDGGQTKSF